MVRPLPFALACVLIFLTSFSSESLAGLHNGGIESNYFGKLTDVNADQNSITIKNEDTDEPETFQLAGTTVVIVDGKERAIKDLKVGTRVKITTFTRFEPTREPRVVTTVKVLPVKSTKKPPKTR